MVKRVVLALLLTCLCLTTPLVQSQSLNDLWRESWGNCGGVPCLSITNATSSGPWTGNDTLNDLFKLSFATCSGVPCMRVSIDGGASTIPAPGSNTQVLFNDSGVIGADAGFTYVKGTDTATLGALVLTTALPATSGGTGQASYAVGDVLYASTTTALSKLADVAAGSYLRSGGANTAPVWSTTTLPNSATTGDLLYASATNVYSNRAAVAAGSYLRSAGTSTAPVWSTVTLPNAATTGDLLSVSATSTYANIAAVATGQVLASAGTGTLPAYTASPALTTVTLGAGTGTGTYKPSGVIATNITPQATTGTSEETLASVTIPGNTLAVNGQALRITAYFTSAANTNAKTVALRWNGTAGTIITSNTGFTASGAAVVLTGNVIRTGAATQVLGGPGLASGTAVRATVTSDVITLSGDIVVYVRGTTATASGDVTFQALTVEYLP